MYTSAFDCALSSGAAVVAAASAFAVSLVSFVSSAAVAVVSADVEAAVVVVSSVEDSVEVSEAASVEAVSSGTVDAGSALPQPVSEVTPLGELEQTSEANGNTVTIVTRHLMRDGRYPATDYATLRNLKTAVKKAYEQRFVLRRK